MVSIKVILKVVRRDGIDGFLKELIRYSQANVFPKTIIRYRYLTNRIIKGYSAVAHPTDNIFISPNKIKYLTSPCVNNKIIHNTEKMPYTRCLSKNHEYYKYISRGAFPTIRSIGRILGGEWDDPVYEFSDLFEFKSLKNHFEENIPWEDTLYYKIITEWINNGCIPRGCTSINEFKKKCEKTDELYNNIKKEGYKSQKNINNKWSLHEIGVNIGRNGEILFNRNGHHRLSISKILNLEKVPVNVIVRHKSWQKKRELLYNDPDNIKNFDVDKSHPDLQDIMK